MAPAGTAGGPAAGSSYRELLVSVDAEAAAAHDADTSAEHTSRTNRGGPLGRARTLATAAAAGTALACSAWALAPRRGSLRSSAAQPLTLQQLAVAGRYQCEQYGCHVAYDQDYPCQCNEDCTSYGDCCADYQDACLASPTTQAPRLVETTTTVPFTTGHSSSCQGLPRGSDYTSFTLLRDAPVRSSKSDEGDVVSHKLACDIIPARPEGEWLKLFCEQGYIKVHEAPEAVLGFSPQADAGLGDVVQLRSLKYVRLPPRQTCSEASAEAAAVEASATSDKWHSISTRSACEDAAASLGLADTVAQEVDDNTALPGCYWAEISQGVWQLLLVHSPENGGGTSSMGHQLCASEEDACQPPGTSTVTETTTFTTIFVKVEKVTPENTRLFCFELVLMTSSTEPELARMQYEKHLGIFECTEWMLMSTAGKLQVGPHEALEIVTGIAGKGNTSNAGTTTNSWLNTEAFIKAWDAVVSDGRYRQHDWVVKADPDAVFLPARLRARLAPHTGHGGPSVAIYLTSCDRTFTKPETFKYKLFGSLEVFAKGAIDVYAEGRDRCTSELQWKGWGEDYYLQSCMTLLQVQSAFDSTLIADGRCRTAPCDDSSRVAYHPYKDLEGYEACWRASVGPADAQQHEEAAKKRVDLSRTPLSLPAPAPAPSPTPTPSPGGWPPMTDQRAPPALNPFAQSSQGATWQASAQAAEYDWKPVPVETWSTPSTLPPESSDGFNPFGWLGIH